MGASARDADELTSPHLAERQTELEALDAALDGAGQGHPAVVLVTGDAGLGKTRLVGELENAARERGDVVLHGQCVELSVGELPYAPVAAALRGADATVLAAALAALGVDARRELARAFPDIVAETAAELASDDRFGQSRLFGWILSLLRELCAERTVLLVLEDVHLADTSSRDFLRFLAVNLRTEQLLVVVTLRSDDLHREHPARALLGELQRDPSVTRLELTPLTEAGIRRQAEGILGRPPEPALLASLMARAQGNPLYTEELLAAGPAADGLPATLQDALLVRVDQLGQSAREVLRLVAAAGRPVDEAVISATSELEARALEAALRESVDHQMLVCDRRTGRYAVRHSLVGEAVYGDLLPVERSSLHRRLAGALERVASAENAADRAHHWQLAHEDGRALHASIEAALAAERVFGYGEALAHYRRAVELWERDPPATEVHSLDLVALLARAAQAARWVGESDTALELCQRALGAVDHEHDAIRAVRLYERLGRYQPWNIDGSLVAYRRGLELLPAGHVELRMRLFVDEAQALSFLGRWEETRDRAAEALALHDGEATIAEQSAARALLGTAMAFLGDPAGGEFQLRQALTLALRAGRTEDVVQAYLDLGEVLRLAGRVEEAITVMTEGEREASARGARMYGDFMAANAADDLFRLGRWSELDERLPELERRQLDHPSALLVKSVSGRLSAACGAFEPASARFEAASELCVEVGLPECVPVAYSGWADLELWRGEPLRARERVAAGFEQLGAGENLLHVPPLHSVGARVEADLAELARARKDDVGAAAAVTAARAHHERLSELLEPIEESGRPPDASAHLAECAAELTRACHEPDPAAWAAVAELWRAHGTPYRLAYARFREGEALVIVRAVRAQVRAALGEAARLAAELGAQPLAEAVSALARRARLRLDERDREETPSSAVAARDGDGNLFGLTERELEVLRLVAAGMTNREISQALFISQHTAGVHVSHILAKLDVANRVMAAGVAERLGIVPRG